MALGQVVIASVGKDLWFNSYPEPNWTSREETVENRRARVRWQDAATKVGAFHAFEAKHRKSKVFVQKILI